MADYIPTSEADLMLAGRPEQRRYGAGYVDTVSSSNCDGRTVN